MRNLSMEGFTNGAVNGHVNPDPEQDIRPTREPIAIIGMGLRLPGGIHSPEALWELLVNKKETSGPIPPSRFNAAGFYSASKRPGTILVQRGHFLDESDGLDCLDTSFFSMSKAEVEMLDPQQRMLLEVVWQCMENAGQRDWRGSNTGVFVGTWGDDWQDFLAKDPQQSGGMLSVSGAGDFAISNRISYEYNLQGPSMTIKAACASSMICLHEACQAVSEGDCDAAIVAGTNLIVTPTTTIAQTEAGVISPTGQCRTFDASANGYARGEAINAILIKKLSDAIRDRDPIRAIIRGSAVNSDGRSAGISAPNPMAHAKMIRRAYEVAGLSNNPEDTPFVEVHGTGTPSGDPLELQAIANVFGGCQDTYIGSVKANVGHGEGASGLTSIIKAVMMLEARAIPPQVNFDTPNPKIPFEEARLVVPLEVIQWPANRPERISVNSFGITGANAHVIVESAASHGVQVGPAAAVEDTLPRLLIFSANTAESLKRKADQVQDYADGYPSRHRDLSYTLGCRRNHLSHRAFCITGTRGVFPSVEKIKQRPSLNFVFTGQGAQWPTMGKELIKNFPEFKDNLAHLSSVLAKLPHPPSWDLINELLKPEDESRLNEAQFAQPLCTAIQVALVNLLSRLGILASAVVGHSSGEIAAAYAAGAITADEAIIIAYYRGRTALSASRTGAMAAVGMSRAEAALYLEDGVVVACDNSPNSITLSGDKGALNTVIEQMKSDDKNVFVRLLKTDGMAYHSHNMRELGPEYERNVRSLVNAGTAVIPFFSSVTGRFAEDTVFGAEYWRQNLESPVKFFPAVKELINSKQEADQLFLEIGPHSALAGPLMQIFKTTALKRRLTYLPSLIRGKDAVGSILEMCGQLHLQTVDINVEHLNPGANILTDLPGYPWQHDASYWPENRALKEWRARPFAPHELLGSRIFEGNDFEPTWRNMLRLKDTLWLHDHKVLSDVVFPCAGYIAMAGEAVRQLVRADDFSIRHLNIRTAMILNDDKTVEVVTTFKHLRLNTSSNSEWYEFSIYSHNGNTWTKHCDGQARGGKDPEIGEPQLSSDVTQLPREVRSPYTIFSRVGLHYGPNFQCLQTVSAMPGQQTAIAALDPAPVTGSAYSIHPTTIDQCLQLLGLASAEGLAHGFEQVLLPTGVDQLYIQPSAQDQEHGPMQARAKAIPVPDSPGDIYGESTVVEDSRVLITLQGCKLSALEQTPQDLDWDDRIAAARLSWRPDLDFVPLDTLMVAHVKDTEALQLMETYSFLCTLEIQERIRGCVSCAGHFEKFRQWIDEIVEEGRAGKNRIVTNSSDLVKLTAPNRLALIHTVRDQVKDAEFGGAAELVARLLDNCVGVCEGETQILDVYLRDDGLINLYGLTGDRIDSRKFFVTAGHTNPTMRVLEIGAGTGGTTLLALQALTSINGEPIFTDISSGFFSAAKERFSEYPGLEFKTLDIGKNPIGQGFEAGTYDLIVATNVIHATESLATTLKNVRQLLHPRGRLFLQEHTPSIAKMINLIMGPLPGWWLGEADGRPTEPIVSPERWDMELRNAGFSGIECIVHDDPNCVDHIGVNMIATPVRKPSNFRSVTVLLRESQVGSKSVRLVERTLHSKGYHIDICVLGSTQPPIFQDIISLLEVDSPFLSSISSQEFAALQQIIGNLGSSRLLWVMGSAQIGVQNPNYGLALGFTRSIRAELSPALATLEVDKADARATETIVNVLEKFKDTASSANPEQEYALRDGVVHVGRYHWVQVSKELAGSHDMSQQPLRLERRRAGGSKVFEWTPYYPRPLGGKDVVVIPAYAGISLETEAGEANSLLALEGSGTVVAVGSEVESINVGDRVMILGENCLSTSITTLADQAVQIPDTLALQDAATLPLAFCTAIYSVIKVANLQKNQTILIHSACGSIGLAAIQLCQMTGAEIFCTVGSDEGVEYLVTSSNIPRSHIFYSADTSFVPALMNVTKNRGVDVVLSSLSGELLHGSWKCVASRGKMIQFGNRNFIGRAQLDIDLFAGNRSFIGVDTSTLQDLYHEFLEKTIQLYNDGHIKPIATHSVLGNDEIRDISTILRKGESVGKLLAKIPPTAEDLHLAPIEPELKLRENAAYLLVGGLGGLGQSVSKYLVEHGARHLVYLSRNAGESEEHQRFFRELECQGCSVQAIIGDVTKLGDVKKAVQDASLPIAGIFQMAMVLNDRPYMSMSHDDWCRALKPKVNGTWNLHEATQDTKLEFFVIFGSVSGSFGLAHQANYSAGNTFQDSFVQYRHSCGLPASVLNIGAMADVGYVSQNPGVEEYLRGAGMPFMSEAEFFESLHLSIRQQVPTSRGGSTLGRVRAGITNTTQLTLGIRSTKPMDDPSNRVLWKHDRRANIYRNIEAARLRQSTNAGNGGDEDKLAAFMVEVQSSPSLLYHVETLAFLTHEIGISIYNLMLQPLDELDVSKSLVTLGVDSLVIVEIRNWLRQRLQVEASTLEILNGGTIEMLGQITVERLKEKYGGPRT
ncbi:hypothetical protein BDV12DRAFT_189962 [Aspergillus spectabilis]